MAQKRIKKLSDWDEEGYLYSIQTGEYFSSREEVQEYCDEEDCGVDWLHLIVCE